MSPTEVNVLTATVSTLSGVGLTLAVTTLADRARFHQEYKNNNSIDLSGTDWYAAWQTSVEGIVVLNSEQLELKQRGGTVRIRNLEKAPENPKGGYKWEGDLQFYQGRDLMGWYRPLKIENNASKGIMYLCYSSAKKVFVGMWVGSSYDGPLSAGFVVITRSRQDSLDRLAEIVKKHSNGVTIISQEI